MAYAFDDKGSEFFKIKLRDLTTGQELADEVPDMEGAPVWNADGTAFYYTRVDEYRRPLQVLRHRVGSDAAQDEVIYQEPDSGFFTRVHGSQDRRFVIVSTGDHETSEVRLLDLRAPAKGLQLVAPRETNHEYQVEPHGDRLFILTNEHGAEDYKIVEAPLSRSGRENWRDLVPHKPGRLILDVTCFKDYLVRLEREDGLPRIVIRRFADGEEHAIEFAEEAYSLGMSEGYEYDTETLRFTYSSMTTPRQVFDYNMRTRERTLRKTQEVPSGHNPADYVTRRVFAPAWDGETVPVSLLYRKDTPLDGSAPLLLYGYGSYGLAIPAGFSTKAFSLVDRGFVYAIAHIRGGKDKGDRWYKTGKLEKKTNTFKDFIAAGHYLAEQRFTQGRPDRGPGRLGGRHADGGGREHGAGAVRRHHRGCAVRRCADNHARRYAAAHPAGVARMGQPYRQRRCLPNHRGLFALRQCARAKLPEHPGHGRAHRSARDLLGAREMGGEAAQREDGCEFAAAQDQYGGGPRRGFRPLRPAQGGRAGLRLRAEGGGEALGRGAGVIARRSRCRAPQ